MKKLLVQEEAMIPALFYNLKRALLPLLDDSTYVTMAAVAAAAESRGRSGKDRLPSKKQDQLKNHEENKRKRSLESESKGSGPGLFGLNSNLSNKRKDTVNASSIPETGCEVQEVTDICSPDKKKVKCIPSPDPDKIEDADYSDDEVPPDMSVCTTAYCPPCYELA
jgi:ribosomal protein L12E/L44/L45/RPP1/RPP2